MNKAKLVLALKKSIVIEYIHYRFQSLKDWKNMCHFCFYFSNEFTNKTLLSLSNWHSIETIYIYVLKSDICWNQERTFSAQKQMIKLIEILQAPFANNISDVKCWPVILNLF